MSSNTDKRIASLFDDAQTVSFGCVCFDLIDNGKGKNVPWPGSGWASIEGGKAFRIKSLSELANDIRWWSNLDQDTYWGENIVKHTRIKKSEYLKTDLGDVMKELHMAPQSLTIATVCEYLSNMFNQVMRMAMEFYNLNEFNEDELTKELKKCLGLNDDNISNHVDQALMRAYQDLVICESNMVSISGYKRVTLRKPRVAHAKQILETKVPTPDSTWQVFLEEDLPKSQEDRLQFLLENERPFICKVKVNSFYELDNGFVNLHKLLNMGDAITGKRQKAERNWMCQTELLYYSRFADLSIDAVFMAQSYDDNSFEDKIVDLGPLGNFSYSYGLLIECLWHAYADRAIDKQAKSKTLVTPRSCWLKSADRFLTLTSAMMLSSQGHQVISYGSGNVTVMVPDENIKKLIEHAPAAGLTVPIWLVEKYQLSKALNY